MVREALGLPAHSLLASSTSEAYGWLFKLLCDPGDEILVPRPSYPLFEFLAGLECVNVRHYSLRYAEGWWIDFDSLRAAIHPKTKAILFVHPNNPTGQFCKKEELDALAAICDQRQLALISDEVFSGYPLLDDASRVPTLSSNERCLTFALDGLSKSAGLPQMKAAWISISGPKAEAASSRLELIADTYLPVSTPVQWALPAMAAYGALVRAQISERTQTNLRAIRSTSLRPLRVEGGWYAIIPAPRTRGEEEWAIALLEKHGTLAQPGYFYDFESDGWLVVSLLTPEAAFAGGLRTIEELFATA